MKYLISGICIIALFFASVAYAKVDYEYAKGIDPKIVVKKSNEIMSNIYNGILKIKNKYKELKDFGEKNYKEGYVVFNRKKCYGYCPPWEIATIRYGGFSLAGADPEYGIFLDINVGDFPYNERTDQIRPAYKTYVREIGLYLTLLVITENSKLKEELIEIVKKHTKL